MLFLFLKTVKIYSIFLKICYNNDMKINIMQKFSKFFFFILLLTLCNQFSFAAEDEQNLWYEFELADNLPSNSPANIGKLILKEPAGKKGFLQADNNGFYFSDKTRMRFWGTNISGNACFPDKKKAEQIAENLAFWGFNCVRFTGLDNGFSPSGIFEDKRTEFKDPQLKTTRFLSEEQLDKLDNFIYQLKKRGIYTYLNILSKRSFTLADGVVDAELLNSQAGLAAMFDEDLINLQKEYAGKFFSHYNKYTKLKYCDDPAICLIELTDSESLINAWKNNLLNGNLFGVKKDSLCAYYTKQLDFEWNEFLNKKYTTVEHLHEAWKGKTAPPAKTTLNKINWKIETTNRADAVTNEQKDKNEIKISVKLTTEKPDDLQYRANYLNLLKDKKYLLSFTAYSDKPTKMKIIAEQIFSPWDNLGLEQTMDLSDKPQLMTIPFSPKTDCRNAKVSFVIGYERSTITISDLFLTEINSLPIIENESSLNRFRFHRPLYKLIKLYPEQARQDISEFYIGLSRKYFKQMITFLKEECRIKVPLTGLGSYTQQEDSLSLQDCDFLACAAYWDAPVFKNNSYSKTDFSINNNSTLDQDDLGILGMIRPLNPNTFKEKNIPFVVAQWNHAYPNQFAYESPTLLGSVAGMHNWDGLFHYCYMSEKKEDLKRDRLIRDFFETADNPQQLILCAIGALAFEYEVVTPKIKGTCGYTNGKELNAGPITVRSNQNGAFFIICLDQKPADESKHFLLVCLGEVKNSNSEYKKNQSQWGNGPVILKHTDADIMIKSSVQPLVYALDEKGMPRKKIQLTKTNDILIFNTDTISTPWFEIIIK